MTLHVYGWNGTGLSLLQALPAVLEGRFDDEDWEQSREVLNLLPCLHIGQEYDPIWFELYEPGATAGLAEWCLVWLFHGDTGRVVWLADLGELMAFLAWVTPIVEGLLRVDWITQTRGKLYDTYGVWPDAVGRMALMRRAGYTEGEMAQLLAKTRREQQRQER